MSSNPYTILCIDDEECILKSLERTLKPEGYNIVTAQSGEEGLKVLAEHNIDLVISDQRMPSMPCSEFFRKVRDVYPHVVRIIIPRFGNKSKNLSIIDRRD